MPFQDNLTPKQFDAWRQVGDPLADGVIQSMVNTHGPEAAREFFNQLIRSIDMPLQLRTEVLEDFLQQTDNLDDWVSAADLSHSYSLFVDHGPKMLLGLYFKSLPLLYTNAKGARVLIQTGRLGHNGQTMEIFSRRIAETGQFLLDVMSDDGLQRGGIGIQAIQKVRLIHASIRFFVGRQGWDKTENGVPINQEDLALTLLTFSSVILHGLEQLHQDIPALQMEAYLKRWWAIGRLLGINEELIPTSRVEADWLLTTILQRQATPSEEGRKLTKALVYFTERTIPGEWLDIAPKTLIQFFVGSQYAKMLDAHSWWYSLARLLPGFLRKLFHVGERLEDKDVRIAWVADRLSMLMMQAMVGYFNAYKDQSFSIREEWKQAWWGEVE